MIKRRERDVTQLQSKSVEERREPKVQWPSGSGSGYERLGLVGLREGSNKVYL